VIGTATQIPAHIFEKFDYVALGHIHKPQDVNESIRYSGTPMAYSFGKEESQEKSVTIVDTETMEHKVIPLHPLHRRTTLTGTLEELLHPEADEDVINGYVKLKVTDKPVGLESLTQLKGIYPFLLDCESRGFDSEDSNIKLTIEEYEEMQTDPVKVFESFCLEMCDIEPSKHLLDLFESAVMMTEGVE
jgi:exonuclease SbcD